MLNKRLAQALAYGEEKHEGQTRKTDGTPMFYHPIRVADTLKDAGFDEEVVMAGYLHDTIEDTDATLEEIESLFGKRVSEIVAGNTENKDHSWEERKQHTIDWIAEAPIEVRALIVADKLDNLRSMMEAYQQEGESLFAHFKRGKEEQLWYFKGIADNMRKPADNLFNENHSDFPLYFDTYESLVADFEALVHGGTNEGK